MRLLWLGLWLFLSPAAALAWSNQGHMATGAVTYDALARTDPAAVRVIAAIMASHPDRARFDRNLAGLTGAQRDRMLFEYMARWPDDVRDTKWDRPKRHYWLRIVSGATFIPIVAGQARAAHADNLAIALDPKRPAADRAVALCWLFHITGDMHQPLHAGHRVSWRFPLSDRAATIAWTRTAPRGTPIELHQVWDHAADLPGNERTGAADIARRAERRVPPVPDHATAFAAWTAESFSLARKFAYRGAAMQSTRDPAAGPVLPPSYLADARVIAERRIGQAGSRLAGLLTSINK